MPEKSRLNSHQGTPASATKRKAQNQKDNVDSGPKMSKISTKKSVNRSKRAKNVSKCVLKN